MIGIVIFVAVLAELIVWLVQATKEHFDGNKE